MYLLSLEGFHSVFLKVNLKFSVVTTVSLKRMSATNS